MNQTQLAEAFGCTRQAVAKWSCPRRKDGFYRLPDVVAWYITRETERAVMETNPGEALERWRTARAHMAELDLARLCGKFVEKADVLKQTRKMIAAMKTRLLQIPAFAAPRVEHKPAHVVMRVIEDAVYAALQELSEQLT